MLYKNSLYSQGETLGVFASEKRVAKLQVVKVTNVGQKTQDLECEIVQCHPEYIMGLRIFGNSSGYIEVKVQRS